MTEEEQKFAETTTTNNNGQSTQVKKSTRNVQASAGSKTTVVNAIWYMYGFIAIILAFRFVLKLFGANSNNAFVELVYSVSGALSLPFDTIFGIETAQAGDIRAVFEPSILVAIAVYALIAWGIAKLLTLNEKS